MIALAWTAVGAMIGVLLGDLLSDRGMIIQFASSHVATEEQFERAHQKTTRVHAGLFQRLADADGSTPGQAAYEAYCTFSQGKSLISGAPLPLWREQAPHIRGAWEAAGRAAQLSPFTEETL